MHKRRIFFPIVLLFVILSTTVFLVAKQGLFGFTNALTQKVLSPLQSIIVMPFQSPLIKSSSSQQLQKENRQLRQQLVDQKLLEADNRALQDQFATANPPAKHVLPARIVSDPSFIPGITLPDTIVIDKGLFDKVQVGQAVVYKENAIGKITKVNTYFSLVTLITAKKSAITAKTLNGAIGISKGEGNNELLLENVLLSQHLKIGDMVVTMGDQDISGNGYSPDLIIGKITAIEHEPSALFQKAQVVSLVDMTKLRVVFVVVR
jgi:rod shape-determining protein MreC